MTGLDTIRIEAKFGFGDMHSSIERLLLRADRMIRPYRSVRLIRRAERFVWRCRADVKDLQRVFRNLAILDQGTRELYHNHETRQWLAEQVSRLLAEKGGRPGLELEHMASIYRSYVDCERADRARRVGQRYIRFTPDQLPRSEPFLSIARTWPHICGETNSHLREVASAYRPHRFIAAPADGYTAEEWEAL